jgi:HEAT repeat protein
MTTPFNETFRQLTRGDDQLAEAAVEQIAAHYAASPVQQQLAILSALGELMDATEPDDRWWAVRALAELRAPQVPDLLMRALDDPDETVRQCAALGLRLHPAPQAVMPLGKALTDDDHLVVSLAADALATIGAPSVSILLEVLENGPQAARLEAVRALATIGDTRSIPVLFAALDDESALIEYWASEGLERMGVGMTFFEP